MPRRGSWDASWKGRETITRLRQKHSIPVLFLYTRQARMACDELTTARIEAGGWRGRRALGGERVNAPYVLYLLSFSLRREYYACSAVDLVASEDGTYRYYFFVSRVRTGIGDRFDFIFSAEKVNAAIVLLLF